MIINQKIFIKNSDGSIPLPPQTEINKIYNDKTELTEDEDYLLDEKSIQILNPTLLNTSLYVEFKTNKDKFVGYKEEGFYKYFNDKAILSPNSLYEVDIKYNDETYTDTLTTKFDPMYCKKSDIKSLIKPVIEELEIDNNELDFDIFNSSEEVKDLLKEKLGDDIDMKEKGSSIKKLTANKVALNLMYNYYYKLVGEYGLEEKRVGTLGVQKQRNLAKLDDLINRFQRNIEAIEEQLFGIKITKPFLKAEKHPYPIKGRLWGKK